MTSWDSDGLSKQDVRREVVARRQARPASQRLDDDRARSGLLLAALRDVEPATISCYLSVPPHSSRPEPGTLEIVTALWTMGHRVLVPVLSPTPEGPRHEPTWAFFEGPSELRPGLWGIPEPTGTPLGAEALAEADLVLCSGLAGTHDGRRLGVGGGWYDRALAHCREDAEVWMLLNDDELLESLPTEAHDRRVDRILLPGQLLTCVHAES
ncbi:5-formyltetrahydrofolate cyclo-ligase [Luteococcus japonicus]|uniref:5-formyltetrahydrofolate cyclo-ligase n=1 Tax=Luteococcus japonicus LSP_Lj1 TaxID=1255658 RepID=A0A1R4J768_9ACTN|nr:5-formyltetrahydrofolate cyclo-ligase [Luteococcus japonicus]SJN27819.1 5-formyltetrahydrofolate cyclo-ligase [Luteococcus japonicus LSP_Lj1]